MTCVVIHLYFFDRYSSEAPVQQSARRVCSARPARGNKSRSPDSDCGISSMKSSRQMGPQDTIDYDDIFDNLVSRVAAKENNVKAHGTRIAEFQMQTIEVNNKTYAIADDIGNYKSLGKFTI